MARDARVLWHGRGTVGWVGLGLIVAGATAIMLTTWLLDPHKAVKHAGHRIRHHARKAQERRRHARPQPAMTDAEFDALEEALEPLYKHGNNMSNGQDPYGGL